MELRMILMILISIPNKKIVDSASHSFIISIHKDDLVNHNLEETNNSTVQKLSLPRTENSSALIPETSSALPFSFGAKTTITDEINEHRGEGNIIQYKVSRKPLHTANKHASLVSDHLRTKISEYHEKELRMQYCPNIRFQCNNNQTCCKLPDISPGPIDYGCCPIANAVCCSDGLHCCPNGDICDVKGGTCKQSTKSQESVISMTEENSTEYSEILNGGPTKILLGNNSLSSMTQFSYHEITCKDKSYHCRDNQTCCKMPDHYGYGCCPKPNAVCCSDGLHCCPQDTICDVEHGMCRAKPVPKEYTELFQSIISKIYSFLN